MPRTKSIAVDVADDGTISGYFSTWTKQPDSYGEIVAKGAFADSFAEIQQHGGTVPFLWNHDFTELDHFIGTAGELVEDDHGARFKATFDPTPTAQRARQLARDGRLAKFSFAYDVLDQAPVTLDDGTEVHELRKLKLYEVSLVMYPANPDTSVIEVKSAATKSAEGAAANLRQAIQLIQAALGELGDGAQGGAAGGASGTAEDSGSGNEAQASEDQSAGNDESGSGTTESDASSTDESGSTEQGTDDTGTTESSDGTTESSDGTTETGGGSTDATPDGGTSRDALLQRIKSLIN